MQSQMRSAPSSVGLSMSIFMPVLMPGSTNMRLDVEVGFADLAQRGVDGRHDGGDDDVRDLAGRHAVHLEEIDEEDAVLVDGLRAMRGDAPVRGEFGLFAVELVEAERRIGVADIESEQHCFFSS